MNRAILLQTEATAFKKRALSDLLNRGTREVNRTLPLRQGCKSASESQNDIQSNIQMPHAAANAREQPEEEGRADGA